MNPYREECEVVFRGTLIEGPGVDLIRLAGLNPSDSSEEAIWNQISRRSLLVDVLGCEEIEIESVDEIPGLSDSLFEYRCGPSSVFIPKLRQALLDYLGKRA